MTLITSCRSVQTATVCAELKKHEIPVTRKCQVSFKFNRCRCFDFDLNSWQMIGEAENLPLESCEGIDGFFVQDEALNIRPNVKAMFRLKENLCQSVDLSKNSSKNTTAQKMSVDERSSSHLYVSEILNLREIE